MDTEAPDVSDSMRLRADARDNYQRLLSAATRVFARDGDNAPLSTVADEAGVGIATLYRRFPSRDQLLAAVYRDRVDAVCDTAQEILATSTSPASAMRTWLDEFVGMMLDRRGVSAALTPLLNANSDFRTTTRQSLTTTVDSILAAGHADGSLRTDVTALDILRTATGIAYVSQNTEQTKRPLDIVVSGLHARE
jgi:Bacterial regulatory proteins, tetR family.